MGTIGGQNFFIIIAKVCRNQASMVASRCSRDDKCLVRVVLFAQVTKMTKHSLIFVSQPRVFFKPFRLKIVAFVRRFCHFRIHIIIIFSGQ